MGARESKLRKWISGGNGHYKRIQGPMLLAPKGYVPICVGTNEDTCRRFMVHTRALGDAFFCELLGKSEEVYGFSNEGVLRIPFEPQDFEEWFIGRSNTKIKIKKRMVIPT
ncbi:auxin-responsive protein SAUR40-like [Trifolium pratense]|uniref:auxin-responsive protein SAUR40-like n=1 Tax=Trifolium pratense TaxID=57577 RepID=UPI001E696D71|nr:auxin-responsive protein SAUR40-like [Trifolium pratense]